MIPRRYFLGLMLLSACGVKSISSRGGSLIIGTVSYEEGNRTLDQYDRFKHYLGAKTQSLVELEPTLNENIALERIESQAWSLIFAPPGLAAIAISQHQYKPLFPLIGVQNLRSVLVVRKDSPVQDLKSLAGESVALGQPGSATGYYFPIFNLYGLTLASLLVSPTPKAVLAAVTQGKAAAGALSMEEFNVYKNQVNQAAFRILFTDSHRVPAGVVLVSPSIEPSQKEVIRKTLHETPSVIAEEAGFVTNAPVPDYKYMISVVERVRAIFPGDTRKSIALLQQKPVHLFNSSQKLGVRS